MFIFARIESRRMEAGARDTGRSWVVQSYRSRITIVIMALAATAAAATARRDVTTALESVLP